MRWVEFGDKGASKVLPCSSFKGLIKQWLSYLTMSLSPLGQTIPISNWSLALWQLIHTHILVLLSHLELHDQDSD